MRVWHVAGRKEMDKDFLLWIMTQVRQVCPISQDPFQVARSDAHRVSIPPSKAVTGKRSNFK